MAKTKKRLLYYDNQITLIDSCLNVFTQSYKRRTWHKSKDILNKNLSF